MYGKFKLLLEEAECFGKVVYAYMGETHANIDIVDDNGKKFTLTMILKEDTKNDTV